MKNIMTYGEIEYFLYDGDKKEKKVSKNKFMNSKEVSVKHNSPKPEQCHTKSLTGIVIENFDSFCEQNGSNLALNQNKDYDFKSYQGKNFDGGDGPSGTNTPDKFIPKIKSKGKIDRGHSDNDKENRKRKAKKMGKESRIAKMMDYQTTDDLIKPGVPIKQPSSNAGGNT
jgi:hypothetical protein